MVYLQYSNKREALTTVNAIYAIKKEIKLSKILMTYKGKIGKNNIKTFDNYFTLLLRYFLRERQKLL